jgi:hypothetical protein
MENNNITLKEIGVIGQFSDDSVRQIWISEKTGNIIASLIEQMEGGLKASDEVLDNIYFDRKTND